MASTIQTEDGDRLIGAGRDATFIDGSQLPSTAVGIFDLAANNYFADLDISGAPTPEAGTGVYCDPKAACGMAFRLGGALALESVNCHDNGAACIGGGGSANVTVDDLDCWGNGDAYSATPGFASAACIKRAAIYSSGGDTTVTNSYIHDNYWVGLWCDFCKYGLFDVEDSRIIHNGSNGIQWEMSGGWTSEDRALIKGNVIRDNNYRGNRPGAGLVISTANDVRVESNEFGGNHPAGVSILFSVGRNPPQPDASGVLVTDNAMHGDRVVGCGRTMLLKRLYFYRVQVGLALLVLVTLLFILVLIPRSRRLILFGIGGILAVFVVLTLLLVISHQAGATCLNNA